MAKNDNELKIFKLNRIAYNELWNDALNYIRQTYKATKESFTVGSPFSQLLSVILHMGRMILYYIEDSITGLNIRTAYRPDQIKGLAMLAGHDASRPISSRGAVRLTYYDDGDITYNGNVCLIPNKTTLINNWNGCKYVLFFGADKASVVMQNGNYIEGTLIQGSLKLQYATGTGEELQSYNFAERNYAEIDQYYVNVYVNGEPWDIVGSLIDLGYNQKGCVVRTGLTGGIDIFFGNMSNGAIPADGSTIIAEYIVTDGPVANITKDAMNSAEYWTIEGNGTLPDGTTVPLNTFFQVTCLTDLIFGSNSENTALTQIIAPHASKAFVLANELNYKYFFKRMNMFSDIEVIQGTNSKIGNTMLRLAYDQALANYEQAKDAYNEIVESEGASSAMAIEYSEYMQYAMKTLSYAEEQVANNKYSDNTVYIYLVPDISKRISSANNYFTCDESVFTLSEDEQNNILNLINATGQRIITVENKIMQPKLPRFAINVQAKVWDGYNEQDVYASGLEAISNYMLNFNRKDIIPVSDFVNLFENLKGIDSVKITFVADKDNEEIYGVEGFYGIDEYGDIVLTREIINYDGNTMTVRDILPILRGGFTSPDGIEYSDVQSYDNTSAYNFIVTSYSYNRRINLENYAAIG